MIITSQKNSLKISKKILDAPEAWLWVGFGFGSKDKDDERIKETRDLMKKYYSYIPYGMGVGNKRDGGMVAVKDEDYDGYFDIDLSWWPEGVYRLNIYSDGDRDIEWGQIFQDRFIEKENENIKEFAHKEENREGFSIRILIKPDRNVEPFGDKL
ncbi:MAG: hypothetical protein PHH24_04345 [Candidatus Moranbacteria bacterium]|jgi:hypothetical protein|nr:hypothetical protein [Candidatus Moranbacteria bacterium]MDX9855540.1 hypothetical protein [Candidatus Moranbacteria bacterium]